MPDLSPQILTLGFIFYVAFLFSTTCHEAAHALVAKLGGDPTAALGGQVSLNPIPHIRRSPYGMVIFPLLSFFFLNGSMIGFASAPYNPALALGPLFRPAWIRRCLFICALFVESFVGCLQSPACSAARRQFRHHPVHE